jgi:ATP-dependent helicase/nuclease subunit A
VDEFQDTSPAQARLLGLLRSEAPVTLVGDEKQSIYAFRGADVQVFREERSRLTSEAGIDVELVTSYRSHTALVGVINRVFAKVLGEVAAPLRAERVASALPGPFVRWLELDARGLAADAAGFAEAGRLAHELRALLGADPPLLVDDGAGGVRPLRAGDVAVLARSRASLEPLEALAPALGVPTLNAGGGDVLSTPEGLDAEALLRAITDPGDAPALLAVLRGPFVAAADSAIHAHAHGALQPSPAWWTRLAASPDARLRAGAALLDALRALQARGATALDLLREADARTGYAAVLANLPNAARRLADWTGMLDLVAQLEGGSAGAFALARRLGRLRAAGVEVPRPPLRSLDAVALLSIHGAKGLEWPVVVVADLARPARGARDEVEVDPELGVTLRWRDGEGGWAEPALHRLAVARARTRAAAEEARLGYVALTRARDLLLLSARAATGGLLDVLRPGLEAAELKPEVYAVPAAGESPLPPLPPVQSPVDDGDHFWMLRWGSEPVGATAADAGEGRARSDAVAEPPLAPADEYAGAPLFAAAAAPAASDWQRALRALRTLDEDAVWWRAAASLAEAGLPAPEPEDLLAVLPGPAGVPIEAVMRWAGGAGRPGVALAAPEDVPTASVATAGWTLLAFDPLLPDAVLPRLRAALASAAGDGSHEPDE